MTYELPPIDDIVSAALAEDLGVPAAAFVWGSTGKKVLRRDVTSAAVVAGGARFKGTLVARSGGVVCGLPVAQRVFQMLASATRDSELDGPVMDVFPLVAEGARVEADTPVCEIDGPAHAVLAGERVALNFMMTLSGIASVARLWQETAGDSLIVLDTRKTLPGLRELSKYAVRVGGASNHRAGLFDMVLIKDNHIEHAGGITAAVTAARAASPELRIEVEADTIAQAVEATTARADIVLLDNMDDAQLTEAVAAVREAAEASGHQTLTEASGGITLDRVATLVRTGVDRVSTSALTLAPPLDFGLDEQ